MQGLHEVAPETTSESVAVLPGQLVPVLDNQRPATPFFEDFTGDSGKGDGFSETGRRHSQSVIVLF